MKIKKILFIDLDKCLTCHSCSLSCAVSHSKSRDLNKSIYDDNRPIPKTQIKKTKNGFSMFRCRHCKNPACIEVCPVNAIEIKTDMDLVILDEEKCIGCKKCIKVCPFQILYCYPEQKKVNKCDFCFELVKAGKNPVCVDACTNKAIKFCYEDDIDFNNYDKYKNLYNVFIKRGDKYV